MYVCICNGHRDREIRQAAESGLRCVRTIYAHLGKPARCGRCLELAERLVAEVHGGMRERAAAPFEGRTDDVCLGRA